MDEDKKILPSLYDTKGNGQLYLENKKLTEVSFNFEQHHDGTLILRCTIPAEFAWSRDVESTFNATNEKIGFEGITDDNWSLKIRRVAISKTRIGKESFIEFLCFEAELEPCKIANQVIDLQPFLMQVPLANCYFCGSSTGEYSFKNGYKVIGQQMPLFIGEQEVSLCYRHPIQDVVNILKKERTVGVISDIFIPINNWPNRNNIKEMLNIFCSILTFTYDTRINWFGFEIYNSNHEIIYRYLIQTNVSSFYGDIAGANWSPLPWIIENASLPLFLHEAYDKYQQLWDNWDIYALINLFTELRIHHRYLEITGLHFSACAEIIFRAYKSQDSNTVRRSKRHYVLFVKA